jgi:hypothetical protein
MTTISFLAIAFDVRGGKNAKKSFDLSYSYTLKQIAGE